MKNLIKVKLKPYLWLVFACLVGSQMVLAETEFKQERPHDFAAGANLVIQGSSPFYQLQLPESLYTSTAWPDLRDVRVFNSEGTNLPFSFVYYDDVSSETTTRSASIFTMNSKINDKGASIRTASLTTAEGITVNIPLSGKDPIGKSYLLKVAGEPKDNQLPNRLVLNWSKSKKNWQSKVSVYSSSDLQGWSLVVNQAPLMDLTSDDDQLLINTIELGYANYSAQSDPLYYLLVFNDDAANTIPLINKADAVYISDSYQSQLITIPFNGKQLSPTEAEYNLAAPQPLSSLQILPTQNNVVLPLEVEYRSHDSADWLPLPKQVVYKLTNHDNQNNQSTPFNMDERLVQGVRIRTINTSWGKDLPVVSGERKQMKLIFNAQGNEPYLLAWGAKTAKSQSLPINSLIPEAIRDQNSLATMSWAVVDKPLVLGGASRLEAPVSEESEGQWYKLLLWGVLIAGVIGLSWFALRIWQEVKLKQGLQ